MLSVLTAPLVTHPSRRLPRLNVGQEVVGWRQTSWQKLLLCHSGHHQPLHPLDPSQIYLRRGHSALIVCRHLRLRLQIKGMPHLSAAWRVCWRDPTWSLRHWMLQPPLGDHTHKQDNNSDQRWYTMIRGATWFQSFLGAVNQESGPLLQQHFDLIRLCAQQLSPKDDMLGHNPTTQPETLICWLISGQAT